jgi:hypothetical protein
MRIDSSGDVGIGTSSPTSRLFVAESGNNVAGTPTAWLEKSGSATTTAANQVLAIEARATTSGFQTNTEANIGFYAGRTGAQADHVHISSIGSILTSGTSGSNHNGAVIVSTAAAGAAPAERMRIDSSGNVLVTSAGGLGYGTGAGGTVTQATSRTTGVTLSKPTGAITMFSAAGSATAATFTVTNTLVAATDTIILNQKSGTNLYVLLVTAVAAGSFNITFYTTGGTATDAPVINFALIKGVTA